MYKIILSFIGSFVFSIDSNAQHLIKGQVIDKETGLPMKGVNIRFARPKKDPVKGTVSKDEGRFELVSEKRKIEVKVSHVSYNPSIVKIDSKSNPNIIELERGLFTLEPVKIGFGEESSPSNFREYNEFEYKRVQEERIKTMTEGEHVVVESMPVFLGGIKNLIAFFASQFQLSKEAIDAEQEGVVYLRFVIDEKGNGIDPVIVAGNPENGIGEEVLRVFNIMPRWLPASQRENFVKIDLLLPINYSAKGQKN